MGEEGLAVRFVSEFLDLAEHYGTVVPSLCAEHTHSVRGLVAQFSSIGSRVQDLQL